MAGGTTAQSLGGLSAHLDNVRRNSKGLNIRLKALDGRAVLLDEDTIRRAARQGLNTQAPRSAKNIEHGNRRNFSRSGQSRSEPIEERNFDAVENRARLVGGRRNKWTATILPGNDTHAS